MNGRIESSGEVDGTLRIGVDAQGVRASFMSGRLSVEKKIREPGSNSLEEHHVNGTRIFIGRDNITVQDKLHSVLDT